MHLILAPFLHLPALGLANVQYEPKSGQMTWLPAIMCTEGKWLNNAYLSTWHHILQPLEMMLSKTQRPHGDASNINWINRECPCPAVTHMAPDQRGKPNRICCYKRGVILPDVFPNSLLYCLVFTMSSAVIGGKRPLGLEISPRLLHRHVAKLNALTWNEDWGLDQGKDG